MCEHTVNAKGPNVEVRAHACSNAIGPDVGNHECVYRNAKVLMYESMHVCSDSKVMPVQ